MMPRALAAFLGVVRTLLWPRAALEAEVLALRHQLLVLKRQREGRRVQLRTFDRVFWSLLSRAWPGWRQALLLVRPGDRDPLAPRRLSPLLALEEQVATLWRPPIGGEIRELTSPGNHRANPTWGATPHPWRATQAWLLLGPIDGFQIPAKEPETALPELADLAAKSSPGSDRQRLRGRVHGSLRAALRVRRARPRAP